MTGNGRAAAGLRLHRRGQGGAFTRAQALAAGHTPAEIVTALRRGTWVDLQRGVYVEGSALAAADVWGEHALRVAARALALRGAHLASRRSAAVVLGLPVLGPVPSPPELVRVHRRPGERSVSPSVRISAQHADDVVRWRGVDCTAPARLVCDLGRTYGPVDALVVADAALRADLDRTKLQEAADRCARWPGASCLRQVLEAADGRVDSPLESWMRWVVRQLGLPPPLLQVDVLLRGIFLGRVDFAWPDLGVVLEADGMAKYVDGALKAEKQRELALRRSGLERTGVAGIPVPSRAARPLPARAA